MKYGTIKGVNIPVSKIVFGCGITPMMMGEDVSELLDAAVECGINAFDTAHMYGLCENSLGAWVAKRNIRDKVVIETKGGCHPEEPDNPISIKAVREDIEKSLENMQTDYIDIFLLHRDAPNLNVGELIEVLNEYRKKGMIRAFGASNWTAERVQAANQYAAEHGLWGFTVASPNFGLAEQYQDPWGGGCTTITGKSMAGARKWYREQEIPILAYSSLARGLMSGKVHSNDLEAGKKLLDEAAIQGYWCDDNLKRLARVEELSQKKGCTVAQMAIAWMFTQGLNVFAVSSASSKARLDSNVKAVDVDLTPEEAAWLNLEI